MTEELKDELVVAGSRGEYATFGHVVAGEYLEFPVAVLGWRAAMEIAETHAAPGLLGQGIDGAAYRTRLVGTVTEHLPSGEWFNGRRSLLDCGRIVVVHEPDDAGELSVGSTYEIVADLYAHWWYYDEDDERELHDPGGCPPTVHHWKVLSVRSEGLVERNAGTSARYFERSGEPRDEHHGVVSDDDVLLTVALESEGAAHRPSSDVGWKSSDSRPRRAPG